MNIDVQHYDLLTYLNAIDALDSIPPAALLCLRMDEESSMLQFMLAYDVYVPTWTSTVMICGQVPAIGDEADPPFQGTVPLQDFLQALVQEGDYLNVDDFMPLGVAEDHVFFEHGSDTHRVGFTPLEEIAWPEKDRCPNEVKAIHMSHGPSNAISWQLPVKDTGELTVHGTLSIANDVPQYMDLRRKVGGPMPAGLEETVALGAQQKAAGATHIDTGTIEHPAPVPVVEEEKTVSEDTNTVEPPVSPPEGSGAPCTSGTPEVAPEPPEAQTGGTTLKKLDGPEEKPKGKRTRRSAAEIKAEKIQQATELLENNGYTVSKSELASGEITKPPIKELIRQSLGTIVTLTEQIDDGLKELESIDNKPVLADELKKLLAKHGA
jgi:hypothetical protein